MNPIAEDILIHYGTKYHSGRYPWGSGEDPYQHSGDFLSRIETLKKQGCSEKEIADSMKLTIKQLRTQKALATAERRRLQVEQAKALQSDGLGPTEIGRKMDLPESTVRSLLNPSSEGRMNAAMTTADFLREQIEKKGMIEVGKGVENELGISREKFDQALYILELEGYPLYKGGIPTGPNQQTTMTVICPQGTAHKEIYNFDKVNTLYDYVSHDGGDTYDPRFVYPKSMDSKRLKINYAEDGGEYKDGVIELRRGVADLDLGGSHYAQVRILVDDTHYLKGMAVYSDKMPEGVDVVFNTNKTKGTPMEKVLKGIKDDPTNPFGSLIKEGVNDPDNPSDKKGGQSYYYDEKGKKQLSLINKRAEEGDWGDWEDKLSSQFLSKQSMKLINSQLDLAMKDKQSEFDEIKSLNNPTVKRNLLQSFSDDCDSAAVHLKAAALPRQKYQVILPITSMKDNEVYAPNYKPGEKVALVRYPHGGTFEIPVLTVNNKHAEAKKIMGNTAADAIGINKKVADRLSGADFDGDTVMVIPIGRNTKITSTPTLKGLEGFDPKMKYNHVGEPETNSKGDKFYYNADGVKYKGMKDTQKQMGVVSNLITDMTLKGAKPEELARAVRHSMVVIDAEKHGLDYKSSEKDNGIAELRKRYQGHYDDNGKYHEGASTLISQAKSEKSVIKTKGTPRVNQKGKEWYDASKPEGALIYKKDLQTYTDKTGKTRYRTKQSTKMAETDDAYSLVSDFNTPEERAYANYANKMKSLANQARKEMVNTGKLTYNKSAADTYRDEVASLKAKLNVADKNKPRERKAQLMANAAVKAQKETYPDMTKGEEKKAKQVALSSARAAVGAKRSKDKLTDREWEAIQAGAISDTTLDRIIKSVVDIDDLRQRATPRTTTTMSTAKISKMKAMRASGYTTNEIAQRLGVSSSTVSKYINS